MNKIVMAIAGGVLAGTLVTTQVAGPLLAQENRQKANIYELSLIHISEPTRPY